MYTVSDAYKIAMKKPVQQFRLTGTVGKIQFTDSNILKGSFSITDQCCDESSILIGQVYIGELSATFLNLDIPRYGWKGLVITPYCGLKLADGTFEDIPLGIFTIEEAKWTRTGVVIKAYDNMAKFDRPFTVPQTTGHIYDLIAMVCTDCGIELGMSQTECEALTNGTVDLSIYSENDIETYRDLVSWLAQTSACNAIINREGKLIFKPYNQTVVDAIGNDHRFTGGSFCDYETTYTGLSCVNRATSETKYYHVETDTGLTYNLGNNPLLQYGLEDVKDTLRTNILTALQAIKYVPFSISMIGSPSYDLMDVFIFSDGIADAEKLYCMTKFTFKYNGPYEMEGVGADPSLSNARSKTDKDISGLASNTSANQLIFYSFVNAEKITLRKDSDVDILSITFASNSDEAQVSVWWEAKLDVIFDDSYTFTVTNSTTDALSASNIKIAATRNLATCEATYLVSGNIQTYHPIITWDEAGNHTIHLGYYIGNIKSGHTYTFTVRLKMVNCSASAAAEDVHALLSGTGLAGKVNWDGTLTLEDTFEMINFIPEGFAIGTFVDQVQIATSSVNYQPVLSDNFNILQLGTTNDLLLSTLADDLLLAIVKTNFMVSNTRGDPQFSSYVIINTDSAFLLKTSDYLYLGVQGTIDSGFISEFDVPVDQYQDITEVIYK